MSDHSAAAEHKTETAHDSHGHDEHHHGSVYSHVKPYLVIGGLLFAFTVITVGLSYIKFENIGIFKWAFGLIGVHGFTINIVIGMIVATFKVCLVGAWFMHLKQEKRTIWTPLLFTFFFVSGLFLLFALAYADPIPGSIHWKH
jgi:caa(3)-type oxidase subunit IV